MAHYPELTGKVAIVTGGGKGIGREIALALGEAGVKVVVAARTEHEISAVAQEIISKGGKAHSVVTDVSSSDQVNNVISETTGKFGGIDIVINNAARSFLRPLIDLREDGFDKIFATNVKGCFLLSREAAKIMMTGGGGRIINITTIGAERGGPMMGAYHASKAAVKMLTMCMSVEWAPMNILVNCVGPGLTRTHFSEPIWANPELEGQLTARIPQGRLAETRDIVGSVLFLCSDSAKFITGQSLYVDGGTLANS